MASYRKKPAQFRISKWTSIAAAPALLGLVAAIALSAQSIPGSASSSAISHRAVAAASSRSVSTALLASAIHSAAASKPAIARHAASTRLATYTVRSGDTLSSIALRVYHDAGAWPVLYWANRNQVRWANSIQVGQVLTVPTRPGRCRPRPGNWGRRTPRSPSRRSSSRTPRSGLVGDIRARADRDVVQRRQLVPGVRDRARVRWPQPGHELDRPLRPVPVQRVDLGRLRGEPGRLRPRQRGRAEPGLRQRDGRRAASSTGPPTTAANRRAHQSEHSGPGPPGSRVAASSSRPGTPRSAEPPGRCCR